MRRIPAIVAGALACLAALARADMRAASIYVQPVVAASESSAAAPSLVAEIRYDTLEPSNSEVASYEAPDIPAEAALVRVGVYDARAGAWASSTSVAAADNFAKGYSPHFVLSLDGRGGYLGVACRGVRIDAGATRDFGPQAVVAVSAAGKQPELNKPVVLSPEGRKVAPPEEKSLLQRCVAFPFPPASMSCPSCLRVPLSSRLLAPLLACPAPAPTRSWLTVLAATRCRYWWVIGIVVLLLVTGGGGGDQK